MHSDLFVVAIIEGSNYLQSLQKINKDECMYSCGTAFSGEGLFVSLSTGEGVSREYLQSSLPAEIFLQLRFTEHLVEATTDAESQTITGAKTEIEKKYFFRVMYDGQLLDETIEYPFTSQNQEEIVPEALVEAAEAVINAPSGEKEDAVAAYVGAEPEISRFSFDLIQEPARKIDVTAGICEYTGERCENLWLNLSDGFIGGGRRQVAAGVAGGTDGARLHYEAMLAQGKQYPLVVKLSTLCASSAEVYSYAEDDMVVDAHLDAHLRHWGVDRDAVSKTGKSLAELEFELNKDFAFEKILGHEEGAESVKDLVGLRNLGNTCYINSLLQLLARLEEFIRLPLAEKDPKARRDMDPSLREWVKIIEGLASGKFVKVAPYTFRKFFCGNHVDFKTHQQQDVVEFLEFIADKFPTGLGDLFSIEMARDLVVEGKGRRETTNEWFLSVQVPQNSQAADAVKRPRFSSHEEMTISFEACLAKTFADSEITDFRYRGSVMKAISHIGISSFPKYLFVAVRRYYLDEAWQPQKIDVAVKMPEHIDLSSYRASAFLNIPELEDDTAPEVASLVEMGFPADLAQKALKTAAGSVEAAMDLLFSGAISAKREAGSSKYQLSGFVSHLGKSVGTGHYVTHWKREKEGQWILFNDEKVTKCIEPPVDFGYLYLYQQVRE